MRVSARQPIGRVIGYENLTMHFLHRNAANLNLFSALLTMNIMQGRSEVHWSVIDINDGNDNAACIYY